VLQIWQLCYCCLRCVSVESWFHLTLVLRNFRGLVSAYMVYIKPSPEDRIPICIGQLEFSTGRGNSYSDIPKFVIYKTFQFRKLF
jgi:hypothetical protein